MIFFMITSWVFIRSDPDVIRQKREETPQKFPSFTERKINFFWESEGKIIWFTCRREKIRQKRELETPKKIPTQAQNWIFCERGGGNKMIHLHNIYAWIFVKCRLYCVPKNIALKNGGWMNCIQEDTPKEASADTQPKKDQIDADELKVIFL